MKNVNLHLNFTVKSLCQFRLEEPETLPLLYIYMNIKLVTNFRGKVCIFNPDVCVG